MKIHSQLHFPGLMLTIGFILTTTVSVADSDMNITGKVQSRFMSYFDSNNDNIVSLDELNAASIKRFSTMDVDGNGRVTQEEFRTYIITRRTEHKYQTFINIDTNADTKVSKEEYIAYKTQMAEQRFQELDVNKDGVISQEEYGSGKRNHGKEHGLHGKGRLFSKLDKNNDGEITLDESLAAWTDWFNRIDNNHDQVVTLDEVQDFRSKYHDK